MYGKEKGKYTGDDREGTGRVDGCTEKGIYPACGMGGVRL